MPKYDLIVYSCMIFPRQVSYANLFSLYRIFVFSLSYCKKTILGSAKIKAEVNVMFPTKHKTVSISSKRYE